MRVKDRGELVADIPNSSLTDDAPLYRRPMSEPAYLKEARELKLESLAAPQPAPQVLRRLLGSPNIASKRWVYRQYDHMVRTNTLVFPGAGAGVVRVKGTSRALALSVDCNARFVYLDPHLGAQHAVAEASRNVACAGGQPIGATNCLNFGNPQRPEIMWQFGEAVKGIGAACRALDVPITGGNVSLYNETDGRGVLPTPVLGIVGLVENADRVVRRTFRNAGDAVVLLGRSLAELGGSEYLQVMHGLIRGVPPALNLEAEAALQRLLVEEIASGAIASAHDCAEGGLAVALAECCFDAPAGVAVDVAEAEEAETAWQLIATLFGESASRVVVSVAPEALAGFLERAGASKVPAVSIGRVGGERLTVAVSGKVEIDEAVSELAAIWDTAIESRFSSSRVLA
jgi:phosphoribosylformylglycinamidine synthase